MPLSDADIDGWPYSTGLLVKFTAFLGSLHWPVGEGDLVIGGSPMWKCLSFTSFRGLFWRLHYLNTSGEDAELLFKQLLLLLKWLFGVPVGFWGAIFRALSNLLGGIRRFIPCWIGGNHRKLLRIGWEQCGPGLRCRPKESRSLEVLDVLLVLFGYGVGSSGMLTQGTLKLTYCTRPFACLFPSWKHPVSGKVSQLVSDWKGTLAFSLAVLTGAGGSESGGAGGFGTGGAGGIGTGGAGGPFGLWRLWLGGCGCRWRH